ncbi:hypothetical protein RCCGE510_12975 [Rhizobium sp. CCGE 510]|nr:hypothetical protein RCCGE510_12975 [Rhizobium sp. CCGE 510]
MLKEFILAALSRLPQGVIGAPLTTLMRTRQADRNGQMLPGISVPLALLFQQRIGLPLGAGRFESLTWGAP